jgi:hypothetical protein
MNFARFYFMDEVVAQQFWGRWATSCQIPPDYSAPSITDTSAVPIVASPSTKPAMITSGIVDSRYGIVTHGWILPLLGIKRHNAAAAMTAVSRPASATSIMAQPP